MKFNKQEREDIEYHKTVVLEKLGGAYLHGIALSFTELIGAMEVEPISMTGIIVPLNELIKEGKIAQKFDKNGEPYYKYIKD